MGTQETFTRSGLRLSFNERCVGRAGRLGLAGVCLAVVLLSSTGWAATYSGGDGTAQDPYRISTPADWRTLIGTQNDWDKHFVMTADLDFAWALLAPVAEDGNPFEAGYQGKGFTGMFDGGGHYIRRVILDRTGESCIALFGCIGFGGRLVNLNAEDIVAIGDASVAGLVGQCNYGVIANCSCAASVSGGNDVGGLVGYLTAGVILNCTSTCTVAGAGDVGALLGQNVLGLVMGCRSGGAASGQAGIGGLVGWDDFGVILNCASTASATGDQVVGGLVGADQGYIGNSYSAGLVTARTIVGGLVAASNGAVVNCFWDTATSGQTLSDGGAGKTTAQMQTLKTYTDAGWDFAGETANGACDYWQMPAPAGYPLPAAFGSAAAARLEGDGSSRSPFVIKTAADLATIWRQPAAHYTLAADLDLAGMKWVAAVMPALIGTFDGQGHRIKNLTISSHGGYMGFFGFVAKEAAVSNLGLEDAVVTGRVLAGTVPYAQGDSFVGTVAGFNEGTISACYGLGAVTGATAAGGLVGFNCETGVASDCYSMARVTGYSGVGGLMGWNSGKVANCYSTGYVEGTLDTGGLVGSLPKTGTGSIYKLAVVNSVWDVQTSQKTVSEGGFGWTTAQMRDRQSFLRLGWDFTEETTNGALDLWRMPAWTSYPLLAWQKVAATPLTTDGFESGDFRALPWRTGGDKPWVIATADHYSGQKSAEAGLSAPDQKSTLELTGQFGYGDVSFALQVAPQMFEGRLSFAIDGVEQGYWSGKVWWTKVSFPIAPGRHTLTWTYTISAADAYNPNTAWIDEVAVPLL